MGKDLDPQAFGLHLGKWLSSLMDQGGQVIVLRAQTEKGVIPVGIVVIEYNDDNANPEAFWFPEATPRNKVEAGLHLMLELKKEHRVFITVPGHTKQRTPEWKFLLHLCKYGVLRPVGTIRDQYGEKSHATLFQSVGS